MKKWIHLFFLSLTALLALAACRAEQPTAVATPAPTLVPLNPTAPVLPTAVPETAVAEGANSPYDLSRINNTGRPQLLNAFASW